jgi:hypothetical protein
MIERTIILPSYDNNGKSLASVHRAIKAQLLDIAGGFSETRQVGYWRETTGKVYKDRSLRIVTTVHQEQDDEIMSRLSAWATALKQICLYTHATSVQQSFVYARSVAEVQSA